MIKAFLYLLFTLSIVGCKAKFRTSKTAYILGNNDINTVTSTNDIPQLRKATVLIATTKSEGNSMFCSGTLVKNAQGAVFVITNHHCFANTDPDGNTSKQLVETACVKTKVYFDFIEGNTWSGETRNCLENSLKSDPNIDIAVFQMNGQLPNDAVILDFYQQDSTGRTAIIFHHPARLGGFAKHSDSDLSLPMAAITSTDCKILGPFDADELSLDPILQVSIRHSCDLDHGSSGSAMIDVETQKILGINWGGVTINDQNRKIERRDNTATRASYAVAFLNSIPYTLQAYQPNSKVTGSKTKTSGCMATGIKTNTPWLFFLLPVLAAFAMPLLPAKLEQKKFPIPIRPKR